MSAVPPPYAPREHAQASSQIEFNETSSVTLEWRLNGLRQMFQSSVGESKSKCIKSAVFGDADNLWEVLWYPNSGVQGGEYASLYLSCVPTPTEREQGLGNKWARKGLWWFRFEIKSTIPDAETGKPLIFASKDASDHTFAVKTANWGWQQFARRETLFLHPLAGMADSFIISCTIQAQPQPPAGFWLGMGLPPAQFTPANTGVGGRQVGSGGGLSAWSGGEGASGGVAGGVAAGGGQRRVVPRELVTGVGMLLDDPLYSDVEFVIPAARSRKPSAPEVEHRLPPRRIYANKKLLDRCDYFHAMFSGGFKEVEGVIDEEDLYDDDLDDLSDSDGEDEAAEYWPLSAKRNPTPLPPTGEYGDAHGAGGGPGRRKDSIGADRAEGEDGARAEGDAPAEGQGDGEEEGEGEGEGDETPSETGDDVSTNDGEDEQGQGADAQAGAGGVGAVDANSAAAPAPGGTGTELEVIAPATANSGDAAKKGSKKAKSRARLSATTTTTPAPTAAPLVDAGQVGPKKTKVVIRDAAWSTWWALLYWIYTDIIYFAPLTSTFTHPPPSRSGPAAAAGAGPGAGPGSGSGSGSGLNAPGHPGAPGTGGGPGLGPMPPPSDIKTRAEWVRQWMDERGIAPPQLPIPLSAPAQGSASSSSPFSGGYSTGAGGASPLHRAGSSAAATTTTSPNRPRGSGASGQSFAGGAGGHGAPQPYGPGHGHGHGHGHGYGPGHVQGQAHGSASGDPLGPRPVSAKAIYRLADKLDLPALKLRAFQHITHQLTAANVPAEVFSRFASTFEEVRKVQVAYFLKHWTEIKKSDTMMQIWQQIRHGKHVGFEEVWPLIVGQLDFKPS